MDNAVIDADGRSIRKRKIIEARRQAEIVHDQIEITLGNDLPDLVLNLLEELLGYLDAGGRRSPRMKQYLPGINDRKKVAANEDKHKGAERKHQNEQ